MRIHNPNNLPLVDYRKVKPLQGNLKDLSEVNYEKLKSVLEKRGFEIPLFLWKNTEEFYLLDGHQRQRVMTREDMHDSGSYEVPYILIEAENEKEAKAKLLEITSQYGRITQEGFDELLAEAELSEMEVVEVIHFDALPLLGSRPNDADEEESEREYRVSQPGISIKFETAEDRDNFYAELADMDITQRYNIKMRVS